MPKKVRTSSTKRSGASRAAKRPTALEPRPMDNRVGAFGEAAGDLGQAELPAERQIDGGRCAAPVTGLRIGSTALSNTPGMRKTAVRSSTTRPECARRPFAPRRRSRGGSAGRAAGDRSGTSPVDLKHHRAALGPLANRGAEPSVAYSRSAKNWSRPSAPRGELAHRLWTAVGTSLTAFSCAWSSGMQAIRARCGGGIPEPATRAACGRRRTSALPPLPPMRLANSISDRPETARGSHG